MMEEEEEEVEEEVEEEEDEEEQEEPRNVFHYSLLTSPEVRKMTKVRKGK